MRGNYNVDDYVVHVNCRTASGELCDLNEQIGLITRIERWNGKTIYNIAFYEPDGELACELEMTSKDMKPSSEQEFNIQQVTRRLEG